jgi:hypothetical protein
MDDIKRLLEEEKNILFLLNENRKEQKRINTDNFLNKLGIEIGDIIEFKDGNDLVRGKFHKIDYSGVKPQYVYVLLFNSDGKIGKREKRCYQPYTIKKIE